MKDNKNIDWEMFELLEGGMTAEDADKILAKINGSEALQSEWELLQNTKLPESKIVYKHKNDLLKKDTRILAFAAFSWTKAASVAAAVIIALPIGWYFLKNKSDVQISSTIIDAVPSEVITPDAMYPIDEPTQASENVKSLASNPNDNVENVAPKRSTKSMGAVKKDLVPHVIQQSSSNSTEYVSVESTSPALHVKTNNQPLKSLNIVLISPEVDYLIPRSNQEGGFRGIRPTINSGLALLALPFKGSKLEVKPSDNKTLRIEYRSNQYAASAMLSLKPLKN